MARSGIKGLYYITHINNVPSILKNGILSHDQIDKRKVEFTPIYNIDIVERRRGIKTPDGRSLWNFANLYFQPRNAMLYRVIFFGETADMNDIAIIAVRPDVLNRSDIYVSTGNAASLNSSILSIKDARKNIPQIIKETEKDWWSTIDDSKRKMMAECLIPDMVTPDFIQSIYVSNHDVAEKTKTKLPFSKVPIIPEPSMFFQPSRKIDLTEHLSLIQGDMFLSRMHTLTVSVNCVGVMGKGLASRAKYQFPDVYVYYQDLCRNRKLQMGKPHLYKRENPFDDQLADEPPITPNGNSETWFLLFPTKRHWKEGSDINGIEKGLQWVLDNYRSEGIKSLAIPALGCGLGRLKWYDVGPLMCRHLRNLDINTWIYLPAEREVEEKWLSKDFLLT